MSANCRFFPSSEELISTMLVQAVCVEVGVVQSGYFSAQILNRTAPRKLHLSAFHGSSFSLLFCCLDRAVILH
jgi:hypothetical protein